MKRVATGARASSDSLALEPAKRPDYRVDLAGLISSKKKSSLLVKAVKNLGIIESTQLDYCS